MILMISSGVKKGDKLEVTLPEVKVLSNEIDLDSFKVYHEERAFSARLP